MEYTVVVRIRAADLGELVKRTEQWELEAGEYVASVSAMATAVAAPATLPPPPPA